MGEAFAHGHQIIHLALALGKQLYGGVIGGDRCGGADAVQAGELFSVMRMQLCNARHKPIVRQLMRRQDQGICRQMGETVQRLEPVGEQIGLRLRGHDADIGADARQQLVAGDQDLVFGTMQQHVLGRMAFTDMQLPGALADCQRLAVTQAAEGGRRRRDHAHGDTHDVHDTL